MKIFDNTEIAFSLKSDSQLERAYFLFRMIQNEPMVKIGSAVTNFALKANLPIERLIRSTVFDHFCGGVTEDDCIPIIDNMYNNGKVHSVLDYSVEGKDEEASFDGALEKILRIITFCEEKKSIPFAVFKPSGFGRFALFQKISEEKELSIEEQDEWLRVVTRFNKVCKLAHEKDVPLLIDAEESWMQTAADDLIEDLMETYNKEKAIVFNTLQMYKHDRMEYLKGLHARAQEKDFYIGMKVVRGAYMEKERERAQEKGYPSPICKDKQATDDNYNEAILYMMEHPKMALFAGTHNEESSYMLMELAKQYGVKENDNRLWFGQLFGMSDHISYNLANQGYNVAKYLPFGPVKDVMPYLIRRAEENTSVAGQTSRELTLLKVERKRRKL
ncbi:proline dehydrogenase family protein [Polaribacter sp. Z022]|uniref:proline dehydrogenase family protein n=1 Tax=Polaribacter sp. Z022 TaxID=2927125 RepID=UPI002020AC64|nr:proline dehydrogenase family protein [Polaribacter sp. Z022]MCL7754943.1 proline dehydrogenase family protein [Polaribacter sp. Z022]